MPESVQWLIGANKAMVAVTVVLVQLVKLMLPSPPPEGLIVKKWNFDTIAQMKWLLPLIAFIFGVSLALYFDNSPTIKTRISVGLQTGAFAIAAWEVYSQWVKPFFK